MNTNDLNANDELITRWIDGELGEVELAAIEQRLDSDSEFAAEVEAIAAPSKGLGDLLRAEFPASLDPPSPELFNARIMSHVQSDGAQDTASDAGNVIRPASSFWSNIPWLVAAAAMFVAAFIFVKQKPSSGSNPVIVSEVSNTYAPRAGVEIRKRFVPEVGATVVSLEGLEEVPSDHEIVGELVASYLPVAPSSAPVLASVESGEPVFVVVTNANNVPSIVRLPIH